MTVKLVDLGQFVAIVVGSMATVLAVFQWMRSLFLDRLTQAMDSGQRDVLYRTLVGAILAGAMIVLALMNGYQWSVMLAVSAIVAAVPLVAGVHFLYTKLQKPAPFAVITAGGVASLAPVASSAPSPDTSADAPDPFAPLTLPDVPDVPATPAPADAQPDPDAPIVVAQD